LRLVRRAEVETEVPLGIGGGRRVGYRALEGALEITSGMPLIVFAPIAFVAAWNEKHQRGNFITPRLWRASGGEPRGLLN
jgi:hypothetical protein